MRIIIDNKFKFINDVYKQSANGLFLIRVLSQFRSTDVVMSTYKQWIQCSVFIAITHLSLPHFKYGVSIWAMFHALQSFLNFKNQS